MAGRTDWAALAKSGGLEKLKVGELKGYLKEKGLSQTGEKVNVYVWLSVRCSVLVVGLFCFALLLLGVSYIYWSLHSHTSTTHNTAHAHQGTLMFRIKAHLDGERLKIDGVNPAEMKPAALKKACAQVKEWVHASIVDQGGEGRTISLSWE